MHQKGYSSSSKIVLMLALLVLSQSFSTQIGRELAYMSNIAYQDPSKINSWSCSTCSQYPLSDPKAFVVGSVQGFTGYSRAADAIIIAFRGSSNLDNWIKNLQFIRVGYPRCGGCQVHDGFNKAYSSVKSVMLSQVQQLRAKYRSAKLFLTGHSLGGAMASLAAPDIKDNFGGISAFYTFGQPRVGNPQFARYLDGVARAQRVIHYADIVPHLCPANTGYLHGGEEVWYNQQMTAYKICQGESPSCSNSLGTSYSAGDHSMNYYITLRIDWMERLQMAFEVVKAGLQSLTGNLRTQQ